ncbi:TPA: dinitrogenase iron-molybdenum cofactor [Candidatus Poribacteria bacterium]|nr:dinitrogenase iron-molybdenum cofactor [Candidatus Poribacteria bacterium]
MRVAISTDGNFVAEHFGRCPSYTIIDIDDNKIVETRVVNNPGHMPGAIPQMMNQLGVDVMIAGGMGPRAINFFQEYGIQTIVGIQGDIDDVIEKLLSGELEGGESLCSPGAGKGHGVEKIGCDHQGDSEHKH